MTWRVTAALIAGCSFRPQDVVAGGADGMAADGLPGAVDARSPDGAPPDGLACSPPIAAPVDDFGDGSPCAPWAAVGQYFGGTVSETAGELVLDPNSQDGGLAHCWGVRAPFDLTGDRLFLEVSRTLERGVVGSYQVVSLHDAGTQAKLLDLSLTDAGRLEARAAGATLARLTFDPGEHRWWQIRQAGAETTFETSPDGLRWSAFAVWTGPQPAVVFLELIAGNYMTPVADPGELHFDDLGVCP